MTLIAKRFAVLALVVAGFLVAASQAFAADWDLGPTTLRQGNSGTYVMHLQQALNANGANPTIVADGAFGPLTNAAVKAFQLAHAQPADGLVGPITKAALNANAGAGDTVNQPLCPNGMTLASNCTASPSGSTGGSLSGGAGSVQEYDTLSSPTNNREVGEDDSDVKVLGISIEADESSDLNIKAMKLDLNPGNVLGTTGYAGESTSSDQFEDYADELTIWYGSTQVASVDAEEFNDDNDYVKTISFDQNAIVDGGDIGKFYIAISGVSNLDSDDIGEKWAVDVTSVRWVDAQGATISEDPSTDTRDFSFESFATANDVELKFATSSSTPDAQTVEADDNNSTDGVVLLKGTMKAIGGDIDLKELPVTIASSGTSDVDGIASSYTLLIDGDDIQSIDSSDCDDATCTTSEVYTFDDADFTINEGDTVTFEIHADINEVDGTPAEGDTLNASVTGTNVGNVVAEDTTGEDVTDLTGSSIGEDQAFRSEGISIDFISASESVSNSDSDDEDVATFVIKFKVTAFGDTVYIPNAAADTATNAIGFDVDTTGTAASVSGVLVDDTDSDLSAGTNFDVEDGDSENFTMTISSGLDTAGDGLFRGVLTNVRWNTTDSASVFEDYTFNLDDFKTDYVSMN